MDDKGFQGHYEKFFMEKIRDGLRSQGEELTETDIVFLSASAKQVLPQLGADESKPLVIQAKGETYQMSVEARAGWTARMVHALRQALENDIESYREARRELGRSWMRGQSPPAVMWQRHYDGLLRSSNKVLGIMAQHWFENYFRSQARKSAGARGCLPVLVVVVLLFLVTAAAFARLVLH